VTATTENEAVAQAAKLFKFKIDPARQNRIVVTKISERDYED
jgi:hypothetical protein